MIKLGWSNIMTEITPTEGMASSLTPYADGTKKSSYLSYLIAGFSLREACKLAKVHERTIRNWREADPEFAQTEESCRTELRKRLADELIDFEFTRNFRLVLAKDFQVLFKDATGGYLTESEEKYLAMIRKFYTPQQFAMVKQLVGGSDGEKEAFDFTKTVLTIRLEKEQVTR